MFKIKSEIPIPKELTLLENIRINFGCSANYYQKRLFELGVPKLEKLLDVVNVLKLELENEESINLEVRSLIRDKVKDIIKESNKKPTVDMEKNLPGAESIYESKSEESK